MREPAPATTTPQERAPQQAAVDRTRLGTARIRPGWEVNVIDLTRIGALVEGTFRIPPGSAVSIKIDLLASSNAVEALVVESYVHRLDSELGTIYRAALEFDTPVEMPKR